MAKVTEREKILTRKEILKASKEIFMKKGYDATSMKDIASKAGIGISTIYGYYQSKAHLFMGTFFKYFKDTLDFEIIYEVLDKDTVKNIILKLVNSRIEHLEILDKDILKQFYQMALNKGFSDEMEKMFIDDRRNLKDFLLKLLREYELFNDFSLEYDKDSLAEIILDIYKSQTMEFMMYKSKSIDEVKTHIHNSLELFFNLIK